MISRHCRNTPSESLRIGFETTVDRDGKEWNYALIHGSPAGFRMIANMLLEMADHVESKQNGGWHLSLSPEDIPALLTTNVKNVDLTCQPAPWLLIPKDE
jgi:hypothetical protein